MRSGRERRAADVVPWLLLAVLLALGVAAMHTLGHLGAPTSRTTVAAPADPTGPSHSGMEHATGAHHGSGTAPDAAHDTAFACLTVLAAAVVLTLPLATLRGLGGTSPGLPAAARRRRPAPQRGPPLSLVLTRTVVLRT
uniref:hypothetical protein n=1 Tax=Nonomuraea pusilla TaxID=46177 RepID=UPI00128F531C|nr:hypothetical protein [Nonomuraea pusilla]